MLSRGNDVAMESVSEQRATTKATVLQPLLFYIWGNWLQMCWISFSQCSNLTLPNGCTDNNHWINNILDTEESSILRRLSGKRWGFKDRPHVIKSYGWLLTVESHDLLCDFTETRRPVSPTDKSMHDNAETCIPHALSLPFALSLPPSFFLPPLHPPVLTSVFELPP